MPMPPRDPYPKGGRGMPEAGRPDPVTGAAEALSGYVTILQSLLAEPVAQEPTPGMTGRPANPPEPWFSPAGHALMDAHEGVPRLEAALRYAVTGHPGPRRGGSAENWRQSLAALPGLAAGLEPEHADAAARILWRWVDQARAVHGIDERKKLRHLPRKAGDRLPPRCPNCGCFQLVADLDAGVVFCTVHGCEDKNGLPPVATMATDPLGRACLQWADGLTELAPEPADYDPQRPEEDHDQYQP
jgi:hypothetical protein